MILNDDLDQLQKLSIAGEDHVILPLAAYIKLVHERRELAERKAHSAILNGMAGRSVLARNPEVAFFFMQNFGLCSVESLVKQCKRKFGASRTPSRSAAYRYWEQVRKSAKSDK